MLDLSPHSEGEQKNPINNKDGPEDGNISCPNPGRHKCDENGSGGTMPEFEFGQSANEGLELIRICDRQNRPFAVLFLQRRQEANEEIQEVDAQAIGDDIEALQIEDAYTVQ